MQKVFEIVSGGQSGVDRAALDAALELSIRYSGWCPRGGWAEDYPEPPGLLKDYPRLQATPQQNPEQRTRWNVQGSDGLLLLTAFEEISGGSLIAMQHAQYLARPWIAISLQDPEAANQASRFIDSLHPMSKLNIAGPRESQAPGVYESSLQFLLALLAG